MPLSTYGVLIGRPVSGMPERDDDTPHYQVHIKATDEDFRIAVNVRSAVEATSTLLFEVNEHFDHPLNDQLTGLPQGFHEIDPQAGGLAMDYVRGNLLEKSDMSLLPHNVPGPDNDLNDKFDYFIAKSIHNADSLVYAFGEPWGPESNKKDKVFGFKPGRGIHNIHMNQGNIKKYENDNGVWQDGAILIHFPHENRCVAFLLAFQSQSWTTNDLTGHRLEGVEVPLEESPFGIYITSAMVNPIGAESKRERVTLFNSTPDPVDISGWRLLDSLSREEEISDKVLQPGEYYSHLSVSGAFRLRNKGGQISLHNSSGIRVHGVSYTRAQAKKEGYYIKF